MKITVALFGKPKDKNILNLIEEYLKRIIRYQKLDLSYLPLSDKGFKEGETVKIVLDKFKNASRIYFLDEDGKDFSTLDFTKKYEIDLQNQKEIVFAIGPSEGFGNLNMGKVETISISKLTMQHDIAFLVLMEQLYRVVSIKNNLPYHKV